eukprot:COSAG05_NODE_1062_length_5993_cov_8.045640_6_plen_199_part_00
MDFEIEPDDRISVVPLGSAANDYPEFKPPSVPGLNLSGARNTLQNRSRALHVMYIMRMFFVGLGLLYIYTGMCRCVCVADLPKGVAGKRSSRSSGRLSSRRSLGSPRPSGLGGCAPTTDIAIIVVLLYLYYSHDSSYIYNARKMHGYLMIVSMGVCGGGGLQHGARGGCGDGRRRLGPREAQQPTEQLSQRWWLGQGC